MTLCRHCRTEVRRGMAFCPTCGNRLQWDALIPPSAPERTPIRSHIARFLVVGGVCVLAAISVFLGATIGGNHAADTSSSPATSITQNQATPAPFGAWPPRTIQDAQALAYESTVSAQVVRSAQGFACLCKLYVVMPPGLTWKEAASAMLKILFSSDIVGLAEQTQSAADVYGYNADATHAYPHYGYIDLDTSQSEKVLSITEGGDMGYDQWVIHYKGNP